MTKFDIESIKEKLNAATLREKEEEAKAQYDKSPEELAELKENLALAPHEIVAPSAILPFVNEIEKILTSFSEHPEKFLSPEKRSRQDIGKFLDEAMAKKEYIENIQKSLRRLDTAENNLFNLSPEDVKDIQDNFITDKWHHLLRYIRRKTGNDDFLKNIKTSVYGSTSIIEEIPDEWTALEKTARRILNGMISVKKKSSTLSQLEKKRLEITNYEREKQILETKAQTHLKKIRAKTPQKPLKRRP